jgi:hypothetical protein
VNRPEQPPKSDDPEVVIDALEPDDVANIVKRKWDVDKRADLICDLLQAIGPPLMVQAVIEACDDDKAAQSVADGITAQLKVPQEQRRPNIRRGTEKRIGA